MIPTIQTSFKFSLSETQDAKAFQKDCDRLRSDLFIEDRTVQDLFKDVFKKTERLEAKQNYYWEELTASKNEDLPNQQKIQDLEENYESAQNDFETHKKERSTEIDSRFTQHLKNKLGDKRSHLVDKIRWVFSQKALTAAETRVTQFCEKQLGGIFRNPYGIEPTHQSITLKIPQDQKLPVQVLAKREIEYQKFFKNGENEPQDCSALFEVHTVYTIGDAKVEGQSKLNITESFYKIEPKDYEDFAGERFGRSETFCMIDGKMLQQITAELG
jgi:hypothetical protein